MNKKIKRPAMSNLEQQLIAKEQARKALAAENKRLHELISDAMKAFHAIQVQRRDSLYMLNAYLRELGEKHAQECGCMEDQVYELAGVVFNARDKLIALAEWLYDDAARLRPDGVEPE